MLPDYARCPSGATSIEYAMIGLVMSITCIVGATSIGQHLSNDFLNKLAAQM
jgi:Flp pilus assembly pilin Flp